MATTSFFDDPSYRQFFIGYGDLAKRISNFSNQTTSTFPPYNIKKINDVTFIVELALAGFEKTDIDIEVEDKTLTIKTVDSLNTKTSDDDEWIYRGIAKRKFTRQFSLADNVKVLSAEMKDGMLMIWLESVVPEELRVRKVDIT